MCFDSFLGNSIVACGLISLRYVFAAAFIEDRFAQQTHFLVIWQHQLVLTYKINRYISDTAIAGAVLGV